MNKIMLVVKIVIMLIFIIFTLFSISHIGVNIKTLLPLGALLVVIIAIIFALRNKLK